MIFQLARFKNRNTNKYLNAQNKAPTEPCMTVLRHTALITHVVFARRHLSFRQRQIHLLAQHKMARQRGRVQPRAKRNTRKALPGASERPDEAGPTAGADHLTPPCSPTATLFAPLGGQKTTDTIPRRAAKQAARKRVCWRN